MIGLATLETAPHVHVGHDAAHLVQNLALQLQSYEVWEGGPWVKPHAAVNNAVRCIHCTREDTPLGSDDKSKILQGARDDRQGDVERHVVHPYIQTEVQGGMSKDAAATGGGPRHPSGEPLQHSLISGLVPQRDEKHLVHMQNIGSSKRGRRDPQVLEDKSRPLLSGVVWFNCLDVRQDRPLPPLMGRHWHARLCHWRGQMAAGRSNHGRKSGR